MNQQKQPLPDIMTVEDVASYLKITERSVYGLLSKGDIPAFKVGGSWRFKRDAIEAWISANTINQAGGQKIKKGGRK